MYGALPTSRKLVMADPSTCIGCKTCMAACLMRHDVPGDVPVPRLTLVTTRTISAPVGCHHCAEAPCADACPTGCLYTDDEHVGVHPGKCIGCRNCVLACPYGAVDIVTRPVPPEPEPKQEVALAGMGERSQPAKTSGGAVPGASGLAPSETSPTAASPAATVSVPTTSAPVPAATEKAKPSARDRARAKAKKRRSTVSTVVKCDLCVDHGDGPACVSACPTKALRLIDPQMLERGKQAKRKAAAHAAASFATITLNADLNEEG